MYSTLLVFSLFGHTTYASATTHVLNIWYGHVTLTAGKPAGAEGKPPQFHRSKQNFILDFLHKTTIEIVKTISSHSKVLRILGPSKKYSSLGTIPLKSKTTAQMMRSTYAQGLFIRKLAAATQDGKNHFR
jgi:hypothetical protein